MKLKSLAIPVLSNDLKIKAQNLYTMIVKDYHKTKVVVNNNEDMSCSRLRSWIGS